MPSVPVVRIVRLAYEPSVAAAASLNPRFAPDSLLLLATLNICWDEPDPFSSISRLEEELLAFSPSFGRHECRGEQAYHVFLGGARQNPAANRRASFPEPFEGCLALAHLIEHAIIDFQCTVTRQKRCSGVTGAHREPANFYDVIVECSDLRIGKTCLSLALSWLTSILAGQPIGSAERQVLAAARLAYRRRGQALMAPAVARALGCSERRAEKALSVLQGAGCLDQTPYSFNFSGIPEYRMALE